MKKVRKNIKKSSLYQTLTNATDWNYDAEGWVSYSLVYSTIQCDTGSKKPKSHRSYFFSRRPGLLNTFATSGLNTSGPHHTILIKTVIQKT